MCSLYPQIFRQSHICPIISWPFNSFPELVSPVCACHPFPGSLSYIHRCKHSTACLCFHSSVCPFFLSLPAYLVHAPLCLLSHPRLSVSTPMHSWIYARRYALHPRTLLPGIVELFHSRSVSAQVSTLRCSAVFKPNAFNCCAFYTHTV